MVLRSASAKQLIKLTICPPWRAPGAVRPSVGSRFGGNFALAGKIIFASRFKLLKK